MRILLIGGTGFLGSRVARRLQAAGHTVTILTRDHERAAQVGRSGNRAIVGDLLEPDSFSANAGTQDIVVSMAMPAVPIGRRISTQLFRSLQSETTAIFANALGFARQAGLPIVLTSGASFRTHGQEVADESWPIGRAGLAGVGVGTDALIDEAFRTAQPLVLMMPGQIYGNGGIFLGKMYSGMKSGHLGIIGAGTNCIPRIHVDDCADAFVKAIERVPVGERLIIADDTACTVTEFSNCMANCMEIPRPRRRIPALAVRLVMGRMVYETVLMNSRVTNAKAKRILGWQPTYPSYREGLPAVIAEIEGRSEHHA